MKVSTALCVAIALASFVLLPNAAGAVKPSQNTPNATLVPNLTDTQKLTGASFKPSNGGMEIIALQPGVLSAAGFEIGDTILSIDGTNTTDIQSLISAVQAVQNKTADVIVRDRRTGNIVNQKVAF